jgi:hypothetical protein
MQYVEDYSILGKMTNRYHLVYYKEGVGREDLIYYFRYGFHQPERLPHCASADLATFVKCFIDKDA